MMFHQPYYDPSSGAKVNKSFERTKSIHLSFPLSLLIALELIAASFVAPARKVRIRLRPSKEIIAVLSCLY
jgi:hypothetical protein